MSTPASLQDVLSLALQLSPTDRLSLIEQVASSVSHDLETPTQQSEEHWGRSIVALLDEVGPIDLIYPEIEDPVEWIKQVRADEMAKRKLDWGTEE